MGRPAFVFTVVINEIKYILTIFTPLFFFFLNPDSFRREPINIRAADTEV